MRGGRVELIQQGLILRIRDPLACGREHVGHGVEHTPLALQHHQRGQGAGVGIVRRLIQVQRNRPIGSLRDAAREGQLLALGTDRHVERQLPLDDGVGTTLKGDRRREITGRRADDGDVARRQQRITVVGTQGVLFDVQGLEMGLERSRVIADRMVDIRQVVQQGNQIGIVGADDRRPDGEGAPVVRFGGGIVASIVREHAEIDERVRGAVRVASSQRLAQAQRPLQRLFRTGVVLHVVDAAQAAQHLRVQNAVVVADLFQDRQLASNDLSRLRRSRGHSRAGPAA